MHIGSTLLYLRINITRVYDHVYRKLTGLPTLLRSEITPALYVGGQYSGKGARKLQQMGITGVVNMREGKLPFHAHPFGFKVLHLPTKDQHAPSLTKLRNGVKFMQDHIENGGKVYVHCHWGEGRGPTMAAAYLISQGMTTDDAITMIQKIRTFITITKPQKALLQQYEKEITVS